MVTVLSSGGCTPVEVMVTVKSSGPVEVLVLLWICRVVVMFQIPKPEIIYA